MKPNIPSPKTRLEDYLEYNKELAFEARLAAARISSGKDPETQYLELTKRIDKIYVEYKDKLYVEDFHYFKGLPDLEKFLREEVELKEYKVKEMVRHEKKHARKAWDLGHIVNGFGCVILKTDMTRSKITYAASTRIEYDKIISLEDLKEIANAPTHPSYSDRFHP